MNVQVTHELPHHHLSCGAVRQDTSEYSYTKQQQSMSIMNEVRISMFGCSNLPDWQTAKYGNGKDHLRSSYTIYNVL